MSQPKAYYRPTDVNEVLHLLVRPGINTGVIGGGTYAVPHLNNIIDEVVDLQSVGLAEVSYTDQGPILGAMVRLQTIVETERMPALLRETARQEGPNTLRNAATIGGVVVSADKESELLGSLLVFEAKVSVQTSTGTNCFPLTDFLRDIPAMLNGGLVTSISLTTTGQTAIARVGRTPFDKSIVTAIARLTDDGQLHLALCGVANTPILVHPDNVAAAIHPLDDFRGSQTYRRQMAVTLANRVVNEVSAK